MVLVLETVEKFPQYLYDTPGGSSFGLQLLSRRIKLKLEHLNAKSSDQKQLLDRCAFLASDAAFQVCNRREYA